MNMENISEMLLKLFTFSDHSGIIMENQGGYCSLMENWKEMLL